MRASLLLSALVLTLLLPLQVLLVAQNVRRFSAATGSERGDSRKVYGKTFHTLNDRIHPRQSSVVEPRRRSLVMAHRGGAGLFPENTLYAFARAAEMSVDVIETEVRSAADGTPVVIHDNTVDRTTDGTGQVNSLTLRELKRLDAAYRWSHDGGRSFPLRGRGITVPSLREVFTRFPKMRFNIDIKEESPSLVESLCRVIRESGMTKNVMVASFNQASLDEFRRECGEVTTSAGVVEVQAFLQGAFAQGVATRASVARALQVPEYAGGRRLLTREFVEAAHRRNLEVHAWTINDEADMRRMIALGVDGIITDYPDRLMGLLKRSRL